MSGPDSAHLRRLFRVERLWKRHDGRWPLVVDTLCDRRVWTWPGRAIR